MPSVKNTKPKTAVVENPDVLPDYQPGYQPVAAVVPAASSQEDALFDSEFDQFFQEVVRPRYGPEETDKLTEQAIAVMRIAQLLGNARRRVDFYIGELASAVEDFQIWRYYPGCQSASDFWNETGLSLSVVKNAIQLHRHGEPVARAVGVDLRERAQQGELSGVKAKAITAIAKAPETHEKLKTQAGRDALRQEIESVFVQPTEGAVHTLTRELAGKPERVPCYLKGEVVTDEYEAPKVRLRGELSLEQALAAEDGALYFLVTLGGRTVEFREVSQVLMDIDQGRTPITDVDDLL